MFDKMVFDPSLGLRNQAMVKECLVEKFLRDLNSGSSKLNDRSGTENFTSKKHNSLRV